MKMARQLVSVQRIDRLMPIENADFIEKAVLQGWQTIVRKGEFNEGDLCVFFEIDAVLNPELDWVQKYASFMADTKWRVKTCKKKQVLSQGLALPLSILPDEIVPEVDMDVTEILGVEKWEAPCALEQGNAKGNFPSHLVSKTDETRVQSALKCLEELWGKPYVITVKCDGTSATYLHVDDEFTACSRGQMKKDEEDCVYWKMARKYDLPNKLAKYKSYAVQGECVGQKIQQNKMKIDGHDLFVFNIWDTEARKYLDFPEFIDTCDELGLQTVPILEVGDSFKYSFEELLELADGKYEGTQNFREGIVIRPKEEMWSDKLHGRLSFKVISNKFLLNEDKVVEELNPEQLEEKKKKQAEKDFKRLVKENNWLRGQLNATVRIEVFDGFNDFDVLNEELKLENIQFKNQLGIDEVDPKLIYGK
jgi:RNA ligase (TIGR02306 family)